MLGTESTTVILGEVGKEMAMTVVTISNAPMSLRGDLTKWMQEIATGVYIGDLNSRVREELWERITESVGSGQATLSYATNNELGYQFVTHRTKQVNVSFDGIPLVMIPRDGSQQAEGLTYGFSNQARFRQARKYSRRRKDEPTVDPGPRTPYVVIDIETDGLDPLADNIIEIGALRIEVDSIEDFHGFVRSERRLPNEIVELTGITDQILADEGRTVSEVLGAFMDFVGDLPVVGYNLLFDVDFINEKLRDIGQPAIKNRRIDLMGLVKKEKPFLRSYTLEEVLRSYDIEATVSHRALDDARATYALSMKVNGFAKQLDRKSR